MQDRGRRSALVALVSAALCCAGGALWYWLGSQTNVAPRRASPGRSSPAPAEGIASDPDGELPEDRLFASSEPMSLANFISVVTELMPPEVGRAFAADFNANENFRSHWERARRAMGAPAAELVAKLAAEPEMKELLAKHTDKAEFREAYARITARADIRRLLNVDAPAAARRARESALAGPAGRAGPAAPALVRGGPIAVAAAPAASEGAGPQGPRPSASGTPESRGRAIGTLAGAGESPSAQDAAREAAPRSSGGGVGTHETVAFAVVGTAGADQNAIAFYLSLFGRADPALRRDLEHACDAAIAADEGCEIVPLCQRVGLSRCRNACAAVGPDCKIVFPPDPPPPPPPDSVAYNPGGTPASQPHATGYGPNGEVYDGPGNVVMTYGPTNPPQDYVGLVMQGNQVIGTFYTEPNVGGVVRDANDNIIYTYTADGSVTTCPCPP
ncbi:MAG: hypothetical protein HY553_05665 [Elusimicrobia bacterium]|nr:hypothetical protein [Elusimicrobiota bacterium]